MSVNNKNKAKTPYNHLFTKLTHTMTATKPRPLLRQTAFASLPIPEEFKIQVKKSVSDSTLSTRRNKLPPAIITRQNAQVNLLYNEDCLSMLYNKENKCNIIKTAPKRDSVSESSTSEKSKSRKYSESSESSSCVEKIKFEPELVCNCSLMEYDTLIYGKATEKEALEWIGSVSKQFYTKVGGVVCAANSNVRHENDKGNEKVYRVTVKWAMPMAAFYDESLDANDVATWIWELIPPAEPGKMGSSRGIYVDVDFAILRRLHATAVAFYS